MLNQPFLYLLWLKFFKFMNLEDFSESLDSFCLQLFESGEFSQVFIKFFLEFIRSHKKDGEEI